MGVPMKPGRRNGRPGDDRERLSRQELERRQRMLIRAIVSAGPQVARQVLAINPLASLMMPTSARRFDPRTSAKGGAWSGVANQVDAAAEGARDALSFGLADRYQAVEKALTEGGLSGGLNGVQGRYNANRQQQRARDRYDDQRYGPARLTGQALGTATGVAVTGGLGGPAKAVTVIPNVVRLTGREAAAITGGGAGVGLAGQGVADALRGRMSPWTDYAAAGVGGALAGYTGIRTNPAISGAVAGGVTSTLQGGSPREVLQSTYAGSILGTTGPGGENWLEQPESPDEGRYRRGDRGASPRDQWNAAEECCAPPKKRSTQAGGGLRRRRHGEA
jgi:hypothetical protein